MYRRVAALAAFIALLALPSAALAAKHHTYKAYAGDPSAAPSSAPPGATLNRFFPRRLTVHKGDKVRYLNNAFHTVSVLKKGQAFPSPAVPAVGQTYPPENDAAGQPFFFSGKQKFIYNLEVFAPAGSHTVRGHGTFHNSGAFGPTQSGKPGKYTLKFAKPGKYKVYCLLHPGMVQTVKVVKGHHKGERKAKVRHQVAKQSTKGYANAATAAKTPAPANTVWAGQEKNNATVLAFFPNTLSVKKGTTVTFAAGAPSEIHNMVFGPSAYVQSFTNQNDQFPTGPGSPNQFAGAYIYGTRPPDASGAYPLDQHTHGNGFEWTPLVAPNTPPLPASVKITFTQPGTYHYYCAIHGPSMSGDIVVTQ